MMEVHDFCWVSVAHGTQYSNMLYNAKSQSNRPSHVPGCDPVHLCKYML